MKSALIPTTLLSFGLSTANFASASILYRVVDTPLDPAKVNQFTECIRATDVSYRLMVEEGGVIVVSPTDRLALEYRTTDSSLFDCLKSSTYHLKVMSEDSSDPDAKDDQSIGFDELSFEYLVSRNASGSARQMMASPLELESRSEASHASHATTDYFSELSDEDKNGHNTSYDPRQVPECYNFGQNYLSAQFANQDDTQTLEVFIYPLITVVQLARGDL